VKKKTDGFQNGPGRKAPGGTKKRGKRRGKEGKGGLRRLFGRKKEVEWSKRSRVLKPHRAALHRGGRNMGKGVGKGRD